MGAALAQQNKDKVRPLTKEELNRKKVALKIALIGGVVLFVLIVGLFFSAR